MELETFGYLILLAMALAVVAFVLYRRYFSQERSYRSRTPRESVAFKDLLAKERAAGEE